MHLFGLKRMKPMAAARLGGLRFLHVHRREAKSAGTNVHYLRHASAMSAAIAKNMSAIMSQSSELMHSSSTSDSSSSFMDTHNHYSFIAVVALMSLFLVVTISATGLLLAFCRKKNTVFVAAPKSDVDSQFELDDIESSDIETCHGENGECYMHLSDDYDDDDDDNDSQSDEKSQCKERDRECTKRSRTFPQFREAIAGCASSVVVMKNSVSAESEQSVGKQNPTPLGRSPENQQKYDQFYMGSTFIKDTSRNTPQERHFVRQRNQQELPGKVLCRNPNHKHHHHYQFSNQQQKQVQSKLYRAGRVRILQPTRNLSASYCSGRLHRSHTIHAIPFTERRRKPKPAPVTQDTTTTTHCARTDKEYENCVPTSQELAEPQQEKCVPTSQELAKAQHENCVPTSQELADAPEMFILIGDDDEPDSKTKSPFENLKLLIQDDVDKGNYQDTNDNQRLKDTITSRSVSDTTPDVTVKCATDLTIHSHSKVAKYSASDILNSKLALAKTSLVCPGVGVAQDVRSLRLPCTFSFSQTSTGPRDNESSTPSVSSTSSPSLTTAKPPPTPSHGPDFCSDNPTGEATHSIAFSEIRVPLLPGAEQSSSNLIQSPHQSPRDVNDRPGSGKAPYSWDLNSSANNSDKMGDNPDESNNITAINNHSTLSPPTDVSVSSRSLGLFSQSSRKDTSNQSQIDCAPQNVHLGSSESALKRETGQRGGRARFGLIRSDYDGNDSEKRYLTSRYDDDGDEDTDDQTAALLK